MQPFQHSLHKPQQCARFYAKIAVRALYDEVCLYPKPGLVSFVDSGAHQDMDGLLFVRSLFGLRHYFFNIGLHAALGDTPQQLVHWGLKAEQTMYRITGGVNTHRGAIFALGILCSSLCRLSMHKKMFTLYDVHHSIIDFWSDHLKFQHKNTQTHGALIKQKYAVPDAKQLAIEGYELIFTTYLLLANIQHDKLFFGLLAYQHLLLRMDDINVLYRVGIEGLTFARQTIQQGISLHDREASIQSAVKTHAVFSQNNISPGGVADMISILYFLTYLFKIPMQQKRTTHAIAGVEL